MNPKNELNGQLVAAERMLQASLATIRQAWEEGEVMFNPREYIELRRKTTLCKHLLREIENEAKQFEPSALSRTADLTKV